MIPYIKTITGLPLLSWKVFTVIVDVLYQHLERDKTCYHPNRKDVNENSGEQRINYLIEKDGQED